MAQPESDAVSSVAMSTPAVTPDSNVPTSGATPRQASSKPGVTPLTGLTPGRRGKPTPWWKHPYVWISVVLVLVIAELGVAQILDWRVLLAINAGVLLLALVGVSLWVRFGQAVKRRAGTASRSFRTTTRRSGGRRSGSGSPRSGGQRGGLSRLLPEKFRRPGSGAVSPKGSTRRGSVGSKLRRLLPSRSSASTRAGGGATTGSGRRATSGSSRRNLRWPFSGNASRTSNASRPVSSAAGRRSSSPGRNLRSWAWAPIAKKLPWNSKHKKTPETKVPPTKAQPRGGKPDSTAPDETVPARKAPTPVPPTTTPPHHSGSGGPGMSDNVRHNEDASLQGFGRNVLPKIGPAIRDISVSLQRLEDEAAACVQAVSNIANQAENDLPTSGGLSSEIGVISAKLKALLSESRAAKLRRIADEADALPQRYRRDHETDEDRLDAPRKSRRHERRADVQSAEQDT